MAGSSRTSLSESQVLALLDKDERAELFAKLGLDSSDTEVETQVPIGRLISEIVQLRLPFVKMMHEIAQLLTNLEASIRGNIRFVVLPGFDTEVRLDFGPQLRKAVVTALNSKLLVNHREAIKGSAAEMVKEIRSFCNRIVATQIRRRNYIGKQVERIADLLDDADPIQSRNYRFMSERAPQLNDDANEFSADDRDALLQVSDHLSKQNELIARLNSSSMDLMESVPDVEFALQKCTQLVRTKLREANHVSGSPPYATRCTSKQHVLYASDCIDRLREAILAACDFVDSIENLFDFLNLELWKQRWRVYELWVLSHVVLQIIRVGAEIADTGRVINGNWRLKFTKDSDPILGLARDGKEIDIYYQFYQARAGTGDMPDIAIRLRGDRFIAVVDPKHGESYSRRDLNDVCGRYASAFDPYLSCIVNYFNVRVSEELNASPKSLVLYGVQPESEGSRRFDDEIIEAMDTFWQERGFGSIRTVTLIVLVDGSSSTDHCREKLLQRFDLMLSELDRPILPQSRAFVFGSTILCEGSIAELSTRELVRNLPNSGTDLVVAFRSVRQRIQGTPFPREFWLLTDGQIENLTAFEDEIRDCVSQVRIVESTHNDASPLKALCQRIGGEHVRL